MSSRGASRDHDPVTCTRDGRRARHSDSQVDDQRRPLPSVMPSGIMPFLPSVRPRTMTASNGIQTSPGTCSSRPFPCEAVRRMCRSYSSHRQTCGKWREHVRPRKNMRLDETLGGKPCRSCRGDRLRAQQIGAQAWQTSAPSTQRRRRLSGRPDDMQRRGCTRPPANPDCRRHG